MTINIYHDHGAIASNGNTAYDTHLQDILHYVDCEAAIKSSTAFDLLVKMDEWVTHYHDHDIMILSVFFMSFVEEIDIIKGGCMLICLYA